MLRRDGELYGHAARGSSVADDAHRKRGSRLEPRRSRCAITRHSRPRASAPEALVPVGHQLDARLPTSIAHWHEHVDFCGPQPEAVRSGKVKIDGATTAQWLKITTREACDAAGGRFVPRLFGWMAHAYFFASDDPKVIWGGEHGAMDTHVHKP